MATTLAVKPSVWVVPEFREAAILSVGELAIRWTFYLTGTWWVIKWVLPRPAITFGFIAGTAPPWGDPTSKMLLKILYWGLAAILFFYAYEVFLVFIVLQGLVVSRRVYTTFTGAIKEKGWLRGIPVGLWRILPIIVEPLFLAAAQTRVKAYFEEKKPEDSSVFRYLRKELPDSDPVPDEDPPPPKIKVGRSTVCERRHKLWDGKNMPLPHPDSDTYELEPGTRYVVDYVLEEHQTYYPNGKPKEPHWDFRWRHPVNGLVDSVAIPTRRFPKLGESVGAYKADAGHGHRFLKNEPVKLEGYGAGETKTLQEGKAVIWVSHHPGGGWLHIHTDKNDAMAFVQNRPRAGEKGNPNAWMLVRLKDSPQGGQPSYHIERKMHLKDISDHPDRIPSIVEDKNYFAEVKYDGAMFWLVRPKGGDRIQLISRQPAHREGKPVLIDGKMQGINRAHWLPAVRDLDAEIIPPGTAIQVEVLSLKKGKYESAHARTGALLNSAIGKSLEDQAKHGPLIVKLLKVEQYAGKDYTNLPPLEERKLREELKRKSDGVLHVPEARMSAKGAMELYRQQVKKGGEGIMLRPAEDPSAPIYKVKVSQTWDRPITGIYPVKMRVSRATTIKQMEANSRRNPGSKWIVKGEATGAGGVYYLTGTESKGKVGSGLKDEQRLDMWNNPEDYLGKDNIVREDSVIWAKDPKKVPAWVEMEGMSISEKTGVVRAPRVVRVRFDKESG